MNVVSIDVCGFCMGVIGCWVISTFFLSIVYMAGVLCTMVSYNHIPQLH